MNNSNTRNINEKSQTRKITIGTTIYYVNVHFGEKPLEKILKNRIIGELKGN